MARRTSLKTRARWPRHGMGCAASMRKTASGSPAANFTHCSLQLSDTATRAHLPTTSPLAACWNADRLRPWPRGHHPDRRLLYPEALPPDHIIEAMHQRALAEQRKQSKPCTTPIFTDQKCPHSTDSYSPSSSKPKAMVEHWLAEAHGNVRPGAELRASEPGRLLPGPSPRISVDAILDCEIDNGFGNPLASSRCGPAPHHWLHDRSNPARPAARRLRMLTHQRVPTTLATTTLAAFAASTAWPWQQSWQSPRAPRWGFSTLDAHYGDGTAHILRHIKGHGIKHHSFGKHFPCHELAQGWFSWMLEAIEDLSDCDVVLYQAGADPHEHDPLGANDHARSEPARHAHLPRPQNVAWNLAGGYAVMQDGSLGSVMHIHDATYRKSHFQQRKRQE